MNESEAIGRLRDYVEGIRDPEARAAHLEAIEVVASALKSRYVHGGEMATCSVCGGSNVQCHVWVEPNTSVLHEFVFDDESSAEQLGGSYCADCDEIVRLKWTGLEVVAKPESTDAR